MVKTLVRRLHGRNETAQPPAGVKRPTEQKDHHDLRQIETSTQMA